MAFMNKLREFLELRDMRPADLSKATGISEAVISNYLSGKREPMGKMCNTIASALNVSLDELLESSFAEQEKEKRLQIRHAALTDHLTKEQREYIEKYFILKPEGKDRVHATINFETAKQQGDRRTVTEITPPPNTLYLQQETVTLIEPSLPVCAGAGNYLDDNIEYEERKVLKNKYTYGASYIIKLQGDSMEPEFHDGDRLIVTDARGHTPIYGRVGIFIINGDAFFRQPLGNVLHPYNPKYEDVVPDEYDDVRYVGYVVGIIDDSWIIE